MNKYRNKIEIFIFLASVIILCSPLLLHAQDKTITLYGNVTNRKGVALMDVRVEIQESTKHTVTDEFGNFSIDLSIDNRNLTFMTEGYEPLTIRVVNNDFLKIILDYSEEGQGISDKVYLPWKVSDRRSNTNAVSTINNTELRKSPVMSLSNAIAGRLPGLTVIQQPGEPGYDKGLWRIRGLRTLENFGNNNMNKGGNGAPIVIVDGFERDFTGYDPSEIESFSILKDASATAIYGVRGANGVILVTTKRGQENFRTIDLELSSGLVTPDRLPKFLDSYQYATLYNEARRNDGLLELYTQNDLELYKTGSSPLTHPDNDYYKEFINPLAMQNKGALTLSGGNRIVRYFLSFSFNRQNGLYNRMDENPKFTTESNYTRYNTRANLDVNLARNFDASFNLSNRIEDRRFPYEQDASIFSVLSSYPPNAFPIEFTGIEPTLNQEIKMLGGNSTYRKNPLGMLSYRGKSVNTRRFYQFGAIFRHNMNYLTPNLSASFEFNYDGYVTRTVNDYCNYRVWDRRVEPDGTISYIPFNEETSLSRSTSSSATQWIGTNLNLNYDRTFDMHHVSGLLMFRRFTTIYKEANQSNYKVEDFVFRGTYSYKNRYFAEVTTTLSGAENFYYTPDKRVFLPAFSAAWIISEEPFLGKSEYLSLIKLRASWGMSGNDLYEYTDPNGYMFRYLHRDRWWTQNYSHIFGLAPKYVHGVAFEGVMPNPNFRVEKSKMLNIGLETSFFKNKLNMTADFFLDKRYHIYTRGIGSIPLTLGVDLDNLPIQNEGKVNTHGFELQIGWQEKQGNFKYYINTYVDFSKSKILEMSEPYKTDPYRVETGGIVGQDFGLVALGLFKNTDDINNSPIQRFGPYRPGDIKYADLNEDGYVDENDITFIGKGAFPSVNYALDLGFEYKGFDLTLLFQGASNRSVYLNNYAVKAFYENGNISEYALNRYTDEASWSSATYPRLTTLANNNNWRLSTFWLKNASYLRLKNLEIGYNIPEKILGKSGVDGLRIYLNAYNLLTIDNIKDFDPESPSAGVTQYPQIKIFNIGLNFRF
ncbi:MAG: SusC/RagA family TonB-linked outer membrane protein [Bacteroidales bacterium]|nr:SusC/RagA family TonB-linked outer membrane protein [Bacteroidales bacterium]